MGEGGWRGEDIRQLDIDLAGGRDAVVKLGVVELFQARLHVVEAAELDKGDALALGRVLALRQHAHRGRVHRGKVRRDGLDRRAVGQVADEADEAGGFGAFGGRRLGLLLVVVGGVGCGLRVVAVLGGAVGVGLGLFGFLVLFVLLVLLALLAGRLGGRGSVAVRLRGGRS